MEDSGKVEESVEKTVEEDLCRGEGEQVAEKSAETEASGNAPAVVEELQSQAESEPALAEANKATDELPKETQIELKTDIVSALEKAIEEERPQTIEECDTGGEEIPLPDILAVCEPAAIEVEEKVIDLNQGSDKEPVVLAELVAVVEKDQPIEDSVAEPRPEIVAIDDDEDEDDEDDDDGDDDDDDEDEDDDGVSNEALNDDDNDDDLFVEKSTSSSRDGMQRHALDDFDDDYDDDDDDVDMDHLKGNNSALVVIDSSDDEVEEQRIPVKKSPIPPIQKFENINHELDYEGEDDDDDDDEYDDDDLMNAVVTSATNALSSSASSSPVKKRRQSESPNLVARREADLISMLTRRINYGRIAKKKSLAWLYSKKKREAYKSILPNRRSSKTAAAMRSEQSGGLLHLKISPPSVTSIAQKPLINPSASTPLISRVQSRTSAPTTPQKSAKDEIFIDLDSSPEKAEDTLTPRNQSDDQRNPETSVKKPPDNKQQQDQEELERNTMQQTDRVRDSIQKSNEEVEEVKTVSRLSCDQNKENLQSNEALKKEKDEVSPKHETEPKDSAATSEDAMETTDDGSESTLKEPQFTISSVTSLKIDIKEEKLDKVPTPPPPPPTTEEIAASKVSIEEVQEKEAFRATASPQPASIGASKRRRSSSTAQDRNKIYKPTSGTTATATAQDDEEDYIHPTKKLREELQSNYPAHDRILNEYIEKTSNDSIDTIQRHIEQMLSEIQTLNDMIKAKEVEWNNMLHLKKVKEEICFRLTRRKQCMEIMSTKVGEAGHSAGLDEDFLGNESSLILGKTPTQQQNPQLSSTPIAAAINSLSSNICNFTAVSSSSSAVPSTAQLIVQNRANMKSSDLVKEKANTQRLHRLLVSRNILPKPNASQQPIAANNLQSAPTNGPSTPSSSNQPILNSYLTSSDSVQQLFDIMNGHHNNHSGLQNGGAAGANSQAAMVGRQGPFKDVRSIIADFRQQHPEVVPRRGRRVKNSNNSNLSDSNTILANALKSDTNSRPSSNDSSSHSMSNTNQVSTNHNNVNSFKDVLAPFAKSQGAASLRSSGGQQQNPPYPEVTLHPVSTPLNASGGQDQPTGSLLHGILTKFSRPNESVNNKSVANQNYISSLSPTLARLLTAPERISSSGGGSGGNQGHHSLTGVADGGGIGNSGNAHHSMPGFGVNLSKVVGHNSEITITPVMNSMHQQSMLQQQLQQQQLKEVLSRAAAAVSANNTSVKDEHFLKLSSFAAAPVGNDDDAEDSVDRLVIDEGVDSMVGGEEQHRIAPHAVGQEFNENEVPVCQGCKKHEAQFVCAGCGNQWYCSRECQVTAWDDHSEVCTG